MRAALRSGAVTRLLPSIYAASEHVESTLTRAHAATAWVGSGSVVIGAAAASAWELCDAPRFVTVTAPLAMSRATPPWLTLRRIVEVPPSASWQGCPVATPDWAVVTAYGDLPRDEADEMVYRAVRQRLATPDELGELAARMPSLKRRKALVSTIAATASGSESYLETLALRSVFRGKQFTGFIRQHRIRADGANYRLDMYDPVTRTAVELDGRATHAEPIQRARDARRDARLASIGVLTLRFGYRDLVERPAWCREMVTSTMRGRRAGQVSLSADYGAAPTAEWA